MSYTENIHLAATSIIAIRPKDANIIVDWTARLEILNTRYSSNASGSASRVGLTFFFDLDWQEAHAYQS